MTTPVTDITQEDIDARLDNIEDRLDRMIEQLQALLGHRPPDRPALRLVVADEPAKVDGGGA